jgi:hypothetical protein
MNARSALWLVTLLAGSTTALADFNPGRPPVRPPRPPVQPPGRPPLPPAPPVRNALQLLVHEANQLNVGVQQRQQLGYYAREATARFASNVAGLARCERGPVRPPVPRRDFPRPVPRPRPDTCRDELREVTVQFEVVERSLRDALYSYPELYARLDRTERLLERVQFERGHRPPQRNLRASGYLEGARFDFAGDRIQINRQCMNLTSARRLRFVTVLDVNGRHFDNGAYRRPMSPAEACTIVAQEAR